MSKRTATIIKIAFVGIVIAVLTRYLMMTDYETIFAYLKEAPYVFPVIILVTLGGYITGAIAWHLCLGSEAYKINFVQLFFIRLVTENVSLFNPTTIVAGDGLKAILLKRKGVDNQVGVTSVLLARVALIISAVFLILTSIVYLFLRADGGMVNGWAVTVLVLFGVLLCLGFLALFVNKNLYLLRFGRALQKTFLKRWIDDELIDKIKEVNQDLVDFFDKGKLRMLGVFLISVLHWIFGGLEFYTILRFFDAPINIPDAIALEVGVLAIKSAGAVIPGQIGIEEYGNKIMLQLLDVMGNEIWLIVSLLRRARQIFWLVVAAIVSALFYKKYSINTSTTINVEK